MLNHCLINKLLIMPIIFGSVDNITKWFPENSFDSQSYFNLRLNDVSM